MIIEHILDTLSVLLIVGTLIYMLIGPSLDSNYGLFMHIVTVLFLMAHWVTKNKTCAVVVGEKIVRRILGLKSDNDSTVSGRIINPLYELVANYPNYKIVIYFMSLTTVALSGLRLYARHRDGQFTGTRDLFRV